MVFIFLAYFTLGSSFEILFFLILLFQTERGGICNDFSNLEVKGSHRKMIDGSHSDHAGAKEMVFKSSV